LPDRYRSGLRVARISIAVNVALVLIKGAIALVSGSAALLADAAHSLGDVVSTLPVMVGFAIARRPADPDHPYGHGRAEELMTGILATILLLTAFLVAREGITRLIGPIPPAPGPIALVAAGISIAVKEAMFRYTLREGQRIQSDLLIADAWHHRSDALSSVAALVGIAGANAGLPILDPVAAIAVSLMLAWTGLSILRRAAHALMDGRPPDFPREQERVRALAACIPGIVHVDQVRMRRYGGKLVMDVEISVAPDYTVRTAHALGRRLRTRLEEAHPHIGEVFVHVNPHRYHS